LARHKTTFHRTRYGDPHLYITLFDESSDDGDFFDLNVRFVPGGTHIRTIMVTQYAIGLCGSTMFGTHVWNQILQKRTYPFQFLPHLVLVLFCSFFPTPLEHAFALQPALWFALIAAVSHPHCAFINIHDCCEIAVRLLDNIHIEHNVAVDLLILMAFFFL
ncbi:hypothetical protein ACJX0J_036047, partial [Zea mays]